MKKNLIKTVLAILLSVVCVFGAVGCSDNAGNSDSGKNDTEQNDTEQTQTDTKTSGLLGASQVGYYYYLKLNGIEGEGKDNNHLKWIDVIDFSCGVSKDGYQPVVITHKVDRATPKLQRNCLTGTYIKNGELHATKSVAGQQKLILKITFTQLKIVDSKVEPVTDSSGESYLIEKVSMLANKEKLEHNYYEDYGVSDSSGYYMQLNGIEGEGKDNNHLKWIDVIDFSCGVSKDGYQPVVITHKVDSATPVLHNRCLSGDDIADGELQATKVISNVQGVILKIAFSQLKVVECEIKTVTNTNGESCLIEKVSMSVGQETVTTPDKDNQSENKAGLYMKLDGIEGACNNKNFAKWIDLKDFSYGAEHEVQPGQSVYTDSGEFKPIIFTHKIDCATPEIQKRCLSDQLIYKADFNATKNIAGMQTAIYKVYFEKVKINSATIKTVTDENGKSYLCEEVSMTAEKEIWTSVSVGIEPSSGGETEAEYDQTKKV